MKRVLLGMALYAALTYPNYRLLALLVEACVVTPGYTRLETGTDKYWEAKALADKLENFGWPVVYEDGLVTGLGMFGFADPNGHMIHVDASLSWNGRYAVLAHEGGHVMAPAYLHNSEVFAESVAALVAQDGLREHARYLAAQRGQLVMLLLHWRDIERTAALLKS